MSMTLKEQAWQSGLVPLDEGEEWNDNDWPPLEGGWREHHASVVIDHPDEDDNNNKKQTVVVLGGCQQDQGIVNSVLVLNLSDPDKQWQEGPPMNKRRRVHGAVVCNGGVYVMGGKIGYSWLDCMERIDVNDLLQSSSTSSTTYESHWTTLTCRLSTGRARCSAVVVHNRYIVVMGGYGDGRILSSVDIIDTSNHSVIAGPSMTIPRSYCASVVVGHRIFVVGGRNDHGNLDSVEYIDFAMPCDNDKTKQETAATVISFLSCWTTHSDLVLSDAGSCCAVVAVGSCLVVAGGLDNRSVDVLDTSRNRLWNLPPFGNLRFHCSMVTLADQIAVIGGWGDPSCATLPLLDKNSWCFRQLCEQQPNGWYHFREGMGIRDVNATPCTISTSIRKRVRTNT